MISSFVLLSIILQVLLFLLISFLSGLLMVLISVKNQGLDQMIFFTLYMVSTLLISALIFITFFFHFPCIKCVVLFSRIIKQKLRTLILSLTFYHIYPFNTISSPIPISTALDVFYRISYNICYLSLKNTFLLHFYFFFIP